MSSTRPARRPRLASSPWRAAFSALGVEASAQAGRWALWTPVAFGTGCAAYFGLKAEPALWTAAVAVAIAIAAAAAARLAAGCKPLSIAFALLAVALLGFADSRLATERARAPVIPDGMKAARVVGRVIDLVEAAGGRPRLLLAPLEISGLRPAQLPRRLRVTLREPADVEPGDGVSMLAILDPPPGPASPGGFDFARDAWFARLGGVGLALSPPRPVELAPMGWALALQARLNALRWRLASRLAQSLGAGEGGSGAGLAAAVATSHQAWLSAEDAQDLRDSGLAHMLAIAGLHMAAVTGFVYAAVRLAVAAWPWLALRVSGKKLAAAAGLVACGVYLALSGAHPPARRAAITASVAFLAILCGRRPISMRSLALAALVVLALQPISVVQPGFQKGFG